MAKPRIRHSAVVRLGQKKAGCDHPALEPSFIRILLPHSAISDSGHLKIDKPYPRKEVGHHGIGPKVQVGQELQSGQEHWDLIRSFNELVRRGEFPCYKACKQHASTRAEFIPLGTVQRWNLGPLPGVANHPRASEHASAYSLSQSV
jgi:hypothetical protein